MKWRFESLVGVALRRVVQVLAVAALGAGTALLVDVQLLDARVGAAVQAALSGS